ncbi:hypothetical protein NL676_022572 [Syzygium grande]|nr:hypothetical protein NL676_022572 [Syzygium grande]
MHAIVSWIALTGRPVCSPTLWITGAAVTVVLLCVHFAASESVQDTDQLASKNSGVGLMCFALFDMKSWMLFSRDP